MPRLSECETYWGVPRAHCIRCLEPARCERAHVIDRCYGGLDGVQNIVPLCVPCHKEMPPFIPGEEAKALAWLAVPDWDEWIFELCRATREQYAVEWDQVVRSEGSDDDIRRVSRLPLDFRGFLKVARV